MNHYLQDLNLIDLLSEKHLALRKKVIDSISEDLNKTETHILAILEVHQKLSISEISRIINLSRQGTHKSIHGLLGRGYVKSVDVENNHRDRHISLTTKGLESNTNMMIIKKQLEQEIIHKLGETNVEMIKALLKEEWLQN
ncbi:MarR family winged helix-turn-helix transcriptional regulator [Paenibacillus wynnii]|uniref:MarR family winged helix-turn-helix transcriptional regulator n=1 Tax=Paenibacillus wynnii TaxID=268407 RepID=UPI00279346C5|nr:MarR family transcriptional regulator [Paenibacillus wynnii]MDQ0196618.1 DNA-binding MarR family transcriptional regulator [Paenibacillus wynnii]